MKNAQNSLVARVHYIYKTGDNIGLAQTSYYYENPSIALYGGLDGKYYLTNEFIELAKKNGFVYSKVTSSGIYIFENGAKKLSVSWQKDTYLSWVLRISLY